MYSCIPTRYLCLVCGSTLPKLVRYSHISLPHQVCIFTDDASINDEHLDVGQLEASAGLTETPGFGHPSNWMYQVLLVWPSLLYLLEELEHGQTKFSKVLSPMTQKRGCSQYCA